MPGKDVFRRRWPLTRSVGAAAAIFVMLCCRGGSAQVSPSPSTDFTLVDKEVTIKVVQLGGRFDVKVDPDVFVARRLELARGQTVDQAKLTDLVKKIEELTKREESAPKEPSAEVGKVREELAKARGDLIVIAGPGVTFKAENLPSGYSLEIDFRSQGGFKSPFLQTANTTSRPVRGRYVLNSRQLAIESGKVDLEHFPAPSVWKYEVVLRGADNQDLVAIDPMGVLK